ncbi:MAG TPA: DinB family protein [Jiangellaceae bacterium]|nr:DinB family protein [Jiangellaceae bacterium]
MSDPKGDLHRYLQTAREVLLWKLDGLSEYDVRRPMTPTGTTLLGLVKHVASVEAGYFGVVFRRPFGEPLPWYEEDAEPNADMWATADESREQIVGFYHRVWAHSDVTIDTLELDAVGHVPHWPKHRSEVTLHQILVHMTAKPIGTLAMPTSFANSSTAPWDSGQTTTTWRQETSPGGTSTGDGLSASRARQTQAPRRGERFPGCHVSTTPHCSPETSPLSIC